MSIKKYDAVVAGYTCVDMLPAFNENNIFKTVSDLFIPGKLIEIEGMSFVLGGLVPNTGLAMKKLGNRVFLNGLIGDDFMGTIAVASLREQDADEGMQITKVSGTAFSIVLAPKGIDRIFLESPGCNQFFDSTHIDYDAVSNSRLFHFGYPPLLKQFYLNNGQQLLEIYSQVKKMGVVTSLDFSLPDPDSESGKVNWPEIMKNTLSFVDIFVPSIEEVLQTMMPEKYAEIDSMVGDGDFIDKVPVETVREVGKRIIDVGVKILLIKMGHRGAYLITGDIEDLNRTKVISLEPESWNHREIWCDAYALDTSKVVNASGAGDTAVAAFLTAILNGEPAENAVKYAGIAGRDNLYCQNIHDDLSDWSQLTVKINRERNDLVFFEDIQSLL